MIEYFRRLTVCYLDWSTSSEGHFNITSDVGNHSKPIPMMSCVALWYCAVTSSASLETLANWLGIVWFWLTIRAHLKAASFQAYQLPIWALLGTNIRTFSLPFPELLRKTFGPRLHEGSHGENCSFRNYLRRWMLSLLCRMKIFAKPCCTEAWGPQKLSKLLRSTKCLKYTVLTHACRW